MSEKVGGLSVGSGVLCAVSVKPRVDHIGQCVDIEANAEKFRNALRLRAGVLDDPAGLCTGKPSMSVPRNKRADWPCAAQKQDEAEGYSGKVAH